MLPIYSILLMGCTAAIAAPLASAAELLVHVETAAGTPVEDAIVYAVPASPVSPASGLKYSIDQVNRQFVPQVNVVQAGTAVRFPNSDNIRHSVYSFSPTKVFTLRLYAGKSTDPVIFDRAGLVVLGCNIHDLMVSWLLVVDTPYFAHTDHGGAATLAKLPPGDYSLRTWHLPMTEDQQIAEPLRVDSGAESISHTVRVNVALDSPAMGLKPP
jgi:plastocyanin